MRFPVWRGALSCIIHYRHDGFGSCHDDDVRCRGSFDFASASSFEPTDMPDEIFDRMKRLLSPAQIVELASLVGFWKMYNTIHDSLRIPIEQYLLARGESVSIS